MSEMPAMSEMDAMLSEAFARLLEDVAGPATARRAEAGGDTAALWDAIRQSGFVDALLPEASGGAGLSRKAAVPLFLASAEKLLPVAFDHSMIARLIIDAAGRVAPDDAPILLWPLTGDDRLRSAAAPVAHAGGFALTQQGDAFALWPVRAADTVDGFGVAEAQLDRSGGAVLDFRLQGVDLLDWSAGLAACAIAGRIAALFALSQAYVMERQQFGRPLGNFQAIQHLIAQAAEQSVLATTAAHYAMIGDGVTIDPQRAAVGKSVTSAAAIAIAATAHAVHGAIGISEEYDLQLYTRQLKRLAIGHGSAAFWSERIGAARLADIDGSTIDFIRSMNLPAAEAS